MIWTFCGKQRENAYLAVQGHLCQDAPLHLSISATTADESVKVLWCWKGYWGLNYIFKPLCRGHTTHCKIHHSIKNAISYMLPYMLILAFYTMITNTHKNFISSFTHLPWFAYWALCWQQNVLRQFGGIFVKHLTHKSYLKCLTCSRRVSYWFIELTCCCTQKGTENSDMHSALTAELSIRTS